MWKLFSVILLFPSIVFSQLKGVVLDAVTQSPIEGVVVVADKDVMLTDFRGVFKSQFSSKAITFSRIGYETYRIDVDSSANEILVSLSPEIKLLSELKVSTSPFETNLLKSSGSNALISLSANDKKTETNSLDLLNAVPGVFVQQGALNTNRITIRGIGSRTPYSSNRIRAYYGEIPLTSGDGITVLEDIDVLGMGRIEILKGPASALYGSGLGGVIRFQNTSATENSLSINSSLGSFNTFRNGLDLGYKNGRSSIGLQYSNVYSDGFRENSTFKRHTLFFNGNHHKGKNHFSFNLIVSDVFSRIPSSINKDDFVSSPNKAAQNWLAVKGYEDYTKLIAGFTFTHYANRKWQNKLSVFGSYFNQYESRPFNILDDNSVAFGLRERLNYRSDKFRASIGGEYFNEFYKYEIYKTENGQPSNIINTNNENRSYSNLFAYLSYSITPKLTADGGLNLNILKYDITDNFALDGNDITNQYTYDPILSPRIGLNYELTTQFSLHASVGHGFSHPSLEETLLPEGVINTTIKPEQGYNYEIGSRLSMRHGRTYAELVVYKIYLNNLLLTERLSEDIFYGINAGKTEHQGLEISLYHELLPTNPVYALNYSGSATISENYFTDFFSDDVDYSGNKLPGIPSVVFFNKLSFAYLKHLKIEASWFYVGKQYLTDSNDESYDGYQLVNLKSSYILHQLPFEVSLFSGIKNIFDANYAAMVLVNAPSFGSAQPRYYYPGQPLSFYFGASLKF